MGICQLYYMYMRPDQMCKIRGKLSAAYILALSSREVEEERIISCILWSPSPQEFRKGRALSCSICSFRGCNIGESTQQYTHL